MDQHERDMAVQRSMFDLTNRIDNRDPVIKMREHNDRVRNANIRRIERHNEMLEQRRNAIQIVTPPECQPMTIPQIFKGFVEKFRKASGNFSATHFTLQFGRLRIELSQAKQKTN